MKKYNFYITLLLFVVCGNISLFATHLRAGEITAEKNGFSALNYKFTLTLYFDIGQFDQQSASLDFGDGQTQTVNRTSTQVIGNNTTKNIFIFTHTYSGIGDYQVSFVGENRNGGIINMSNSVSQTFSVRTLITIDPLVGQNNTPKLQFDPIDIASVSQRFEHNPGAYDVDGDSIAFEMAVPHKDVNTPVDGYASPIDWSNAAENGGPSEFSLNPLTGDLVWDSPSTVGEFNVAFYIKEFRDGVMISRITRDMQIIVRETSNIRPKLNFTDLCVKAGTFISQNISATDANNDQITITSVGEPYNNVIPAYATFSADGTLQNNPAAGVFTWQTNCEQIKKEPYEVIFKAEDFPILANTPKLVDFKTLNIRIVGPEPTNFIANIVGTNVVLDWDRYFCQNATKITVWRKNGPSGFNPSNCETGLPISLGFEKIGEVNPSDTLFTDTFNNLGIENGRVYCYRIFAIFPLPDGSESIVSSESCVSLPLSLPILTNVTVDETGITTGKITVKWTKPQELDTTTCPAPYSFELYRNEGFTETNTNTLVYTTSSLTDTTFQDLNLNTEEKVYNYYLKFGCANSTTKRENDKASSVQAIATAGSASVKLTWQATTPWTNQGFYHYIYREINAVYTLIDSVFINSSTMEFTDNGLFNNIPLQDSTIYCYKIRTQGSYFNDDIVSPLYNFSQVICAMPLDSIAPCPPVLSIDSINCDLIVNDVNYPLQSLLKWQNAPYTAECDSDIVSYTIYYYPENTTNLVDFKSIGTSLDTFYLYKNNETLAGCFAVTATDKYGNESLKSNIVCVDNCTNYELPNIFTPNNDGPNDLFVPMPVPRFVKSVKFTVYNRWGRPVKTIDNDIFLNWDGKGENSKELAEGIYFYIADIEFNTIRETNRNKTLKGWIQILR